MRAAAWFALLGLIPGCAELDPPPAAPTSLRIVAPAPAPASSEYVQVVQRVAQMVGDRDLGLRVRRRGLNVVDVTWEDTGRAEGSALGPNISDFTLQVRHAVAREAAEAALGWTMEPETAVSPPPLPSNPGPAVTWQETLMPVIRHPNFADRTGDVPADRFFVRVGNQRGEDLRSVPLLDLIKNLGRYAASPTSLADADAAPRVDLSAERDTHFLVSAQALFLPIPRQGRAEFNPVLFNYQSAPGSPAVLAILSTREGTSVTVVENRREDQGAHWGQELYFNDAGQRACFTAERRTDVAQRIAAQGGPRSEAERNMLERGADIMAMVQVPLVHKNEGYLGGLGGSFGSDDYSYKFEDDPLSAGQFGPSDATMRPRGGSDVERAVLGHGARLGPFLEGHRTRLVRDATFPIRITIQFYKATSTGEVSERDLDAIARSLESVYAHADYVGSLVLPEGDAKRPTAWQQVPGEWFPW
jgi:hypothetical protein